MAAEPGARGGGRGRRRREEDRRVSLSRALSYVLRHGAVAEGVPMGADGFVPLAALLELRRFRGVSAQELGGVVASDPKGRFELRTRPLRVRATQGHSLPVPELELTPLLSPEQLPPLLRHGTRRGRWPQILAGGGLSPMGRNHIHMAGGGEEGDPAGARSGIRPDSDVIIYIDGARALRDGIPFFRSANGVILTPGGPGGLLPPKYFLRVLQLRPHRCLLPLEGAQHEDPPHEEGGGPLHEEGGADTLPPPK